MKLSDLENHPFFSESALLQNIPISSRDEYLERFEHVQQLKADYQQLARQCDDFEDLSVPPTNLQEVL